MTFDEWFAQYKNNNDCVPGQKESWSAGFKEALIRVCGFETESYCEGWEKMEDGAELAAESVLMDFEVNG